MPGTAPKTPRLKTASVGVAPALMKIRVPKPMAVPHLNKIVVNMGMGEAMNAKIMDPAGTNSVRSRAEARGHAPRTIAAFKSRGHADWGHGHARGDRMYEFSTGW
jgi:large subunit ribosomal protein L5